MLYNRGDGKRKGQPPRRSHGTVKLPTLYLDLDVPPEERERADMAISTFYAIWDYIKGVAESLEALEGDCRVVDAIYAAESVRHRTLTTEK